WRSWPPPSPRTSHPRRRSAAQPTAMGVRRAAAPRVNPPPTARPPRGQPRPPGGRRDRFLSTSPPGARHDNLRAGARGGREHLVITFDRVSVSYAGAVRPVLREVDLTVEEGELCLVVGSTGSGKSTLLGAVNGLVPHFTGGTLAGRVVVAGRD